MFRAADAKVLRNKETKETKSATAGGVEIYEYSDVRLELSKRSLGSWVVITY